MKCPDGRVVSASNYRSQDHGSNPAHDCMHRALHYHLSSWYDLNNIEREVKRQMVIIALCISPHDCCKNRKYCDKRRLTKQCRTRSKAAEYGVCSGSTLSAIHAATVYCIGPNYRTVRLSFLTLVLLNLDILYLFKQCRSRSVGF